MGKLGIVVVTAFMLTACGGSGGPGPAVDASPGDGSAGDGAVDGSALPDGGGVDSGTIDTGPPNAEPVGMITAPMDGATVDIGVPMDFTSTCMDADGDTPFTHAWDFGGMAMSTLQDPTMMFATGGMYLVSYTCTDSRGLADSTPATIMIIVNGPPDGVIDMPAMDVTINEGDSIDFQATCIDPDGSMTFTHTWDFGGGPAASMVEDPGMTTFMTAGSYVVTYTCADGTGMGDPTPGTITVTVNALPNGVIDTPTGDVSITTGSAVDFTATCTDPEMGAVTHAWDFGGGAGVSTLEDAGMTTFAAAGTYVVTYTCTDVTGAADPTPATLTVTVVDAPDSTIDTPAMPTTIAAGATVPFTGTCTGGAGAPFTTAWDFGDDRSTTMEDPGAVTFPVPGSYTVTFVCGSSGAVDGSPASVVITVTGPLMITTTVLPHGRSGAAYTGTVEASGGSGMGYSFTAPMADLPPGLSLSAGGVLSGTPTTSGGFFFTVTVTDSGAATATKDYYVITRVPQQWVALSGEANANLVTEVVFVDISGAVPGPAVSALAPLPATADLGSTTQSNRFSPDGRYFAYITDATTDGLEDLYVIDMTMVPLTAVNVSTSTVGDVEAIAWAPDARHIAFTGDLTTSVQDELWIADLTAGLGAVTKQRAHAAIAVPLGDVQGFATASNDEFVWSLDSTKVYFRGDIIVDGRIEAFMFDLGAPAMGAQRLHPALASTTTSVNGVYRMGADAVVLIGDLITGNVNEVFVVDTSGAAPGAPVRVSPAMVLNGDASNGVGFSVNVSADETQLAFEADAFLDLSTELLLVDLRFGFPATGSAVRISPPHTDSGQDVSQAFFSPTDNRIVIRSDESITGFAEELFAVDLRGATPGSPVRLHAPYVDAQDVDDVTFSPDGRFIAYDADQDTDTDDELYYSVVAAIGAPTNVKLNGAIIAGSTDIDGTVTWLPDSTGLIFSGDVNTNGVEDQFLVTLAGAGAPTQINAAFGAGSFVTVDEADSAISADGSRYLSVGDVFVDNDTEAFTIDLVTAPNLTRLNPMFAPGAGQDMNALFLQP